MPVRIDGDRIMTPSARQDRSTFTAETDREFFAKAGPVPSLWNDVRRHPRFYYRCAAEATVYAPRDADEVWKERVPIFVRDLGRGGLCLQCDEQLFPEQRLHLLLPDGVQRDVRVVWCRRIEAGQFTVGCRFEGNDRRSNQRPRTLA